MIRLIKVPLNKRCAFLVNRNMLLQIINSMTFIYKNIFYYRLTFVEQNDTMVKRKNRSPSCTCTLCALRTESSPLQIIIHQTLTKNSAKAEFFVFISILLMDRSPEIFTLPPLITALLFQNFL